MRELLIITGIALSINVFAQIPTTGLVGYYPFNGNANDASGNGHNGILYGATLAPDRFGNANSAYNFDGLDDYIETNINSGFTNQITISAWIKTNYLFTGYDPGIVAQRNSTFNVTRIGVTNQNKADFLVDINGNGSANVVSPDAINDNNWHLLVGTYDGSILKIYMDNVLKSSLAVTSSIEMSSSFRIGNDNEPTPPTRFFKGFIDDVRIYNLALNTSDISLLYYEGISLINHYAYIQNSSGNNVTVINTVNNAYVTTIAAGTAPAGSDIHPNGSRIIIANGYSDNLTIINTVSNTVVSTISCGDYPVGVKYHPDGSKFYISHLLGNSVKVYDSNTYQELANIPMSSYLGQIISNSDGSLMYIVAKNTNRVYVLSTLNNIIVDTINVGNGPYGLAISQDGNKVCLRPTTS